MNRFQQAFASAERPLVFPYLTAGFPTPAETNELTLAAIRGGAAGLEIGVVFSDPLADGPTIQRANTAALAAGATVETALDATRAVRASGSDAPITLMGYLNPFLAYRAEAPTWDNQATPADEVGRPLEPIAATNSVWGSASTARQASTPMRPVAPQTPTLIGARSPAEPFMAT